MDPFVAEPVSHTQIRLSWTEPTGTWSNFRVLRSRTGYSINESDGVLLYSATSNTDGVLTDFVTADGWYYYTIFIYDSSQSIWVRAAKTYALSVSDFQTRDLLWDRVPTFFKTVRPNSAGYDPVVHGLNPAIYLNNATEGDNEHLRAFIDVLGFGFDLLRTQSQSTLWGSDPQKMHYDRLALRAAQLGGEVERSAPAQTNRNLVRNLSLIYRKRGTIDGIQELLSLATGWDVNVSMGPNLMLNEDQANFVNPKVDDWDPTKRYIAGEYVKFNSRYFVSLLVAYGAATTPPATGANTYWSQVVSIVEDTTTVRADTGGVSTWGVYTAASGTPVTGAAVTHIGKGVTHPTDGAVLATNALGAKNTSGASQDIFALNIPVPTGASGYDREFTTKSAIPVPADNVQWDAITTFKAGQMVHYNGITYTALRTSLNNLPTDTNYWKKSGLDRRVRMALSFYAHGPFTGTAGTGGVVTKPVVVAFDETGAYLWDVTIDSAYTTNVNYDTFNTAAALTGRTLELGGKVWTIQTGVANQALDTVLGGYVYPGAALMIATVPVAVADISVGVTFQNVQTRLAGLVMRWTDVNNHWRIEQDRIKKIVAGVSTQLASWTACKAGDRLTCSTVGNVFTVKKNGVTVATVTDAFNNTATTHGIIFE